jgi:hypothetical protein
VEPAGGLRTDDLPTAEGVDAAFAPDRVLYAVTGDDVLTAWNVTTAGVRACSVRVGRFDRR